MLRILTLLCVLVLSSGCIRPITPPVEIDPSDACPVTSPPDPAFVPPPPYSRYAPSGEFWYGTADLWTAVLGDGTWRQLPHDETGYSQKVFWWRKDYNGESDPQPRLTVTGQRLDGAAPLLTASRATNAYHSSFGWAMLVGVDLPNAGCWEITGYLDGHNLSFIVWVEP